MTQKFSPDNPFKANPAASSPAGHKTGLRIDQHFSTPSIHPFDQVQWETRSAKITSDTGQAVFEQDNIEVPASWSQLAAKVVASKYFYGDIDSGKREHSVKQLIHRVCRMIADRGKAD